MARFEIYPNPIAADRVDFPFVLDIQSDLLYRFAERVCVPLVRTGFIPGMTDRLNPSIDVNGQTVRLHPLGITVFYVNELRSAAGKATAQALKIETALDMLLLAIDLIPQKPEFIVKWGSGGSAYGLNERQGEHLHFIDLCQLLGVPTPGSMGNYIVEQDTLVLGEARGYADVFMRNHFAWENNAPGKNLDQALKQLLTYSLALSIKQTSERPPDEPHPHSVQRAPVRNSQPLNCTSSPTSRPCCTACGPTPTTLGRIGNLKLRCHLLGWTVG